MCLLVFGHDSEAEVEVNGYESAYSYKRTITYDASLADIRTVVESSTNCRQFVKVIFNALYKLLTRITFLFILFLVIFFILF